MITLNATTDARPLLSLAEVSARVNVSRPTLYRMAIAGMLPGAVRIGSQWRVRPDALEAWVNGDEQDERKGPEQ